jgi:cytoskeleton protein RodZ
MVEGEQTEGGLFPLRVGDRLRTAREAVGFDLNDIGTRTRIPIRHLEAIERGDFGTLPSPTYAIGFVKAYARALDLDEAGFARDVRVELGRSEPVGREVQFTELTDPARVPSRLLALTALGIVILVVAGYFAWHNQYFGESAPPPTQASTPVAASPVPVTSVAPPAAMPAAPATTGQVTLTATAAVWLRITDANGGRLYEKEMAAGERFDVPQGANDPRILTGRPDALKVTIDGRDVAPLGPPERTIADVPISAAALAKRPAVAPPAGPAPAGAPPAGAPVATPLAPATQ